MSAIDRSASIQAKIKRADEHVRNLTSEIMAFWNTPNRYAIAPQRDPETGDEVFYLNGNDLRPPPRWGVIVGDVFHNLRSALDHLAWQLVLANGGKVGRHIQFPIFEEPHTVKEYEAKAAGMIKGSSDSAMRLVKGMHAYKGGKCPALCLVHALNNVDKHRALILMGVAVFDATTSYLFSLNDGAEILRINPQNALNMNTDLQRFFQIALHEPGILERAPLIPCLRDLTKAVEATIETFFVTLPELSR